MFVYDFLDIISTRPLAVLVVLIGGGALGAGTFSLVLPDTALQVYGISKDRTTSQPRERKSPASNYEPVARSLSVRNITLGLSLLAIVAHWQRVIDEDPVAGHYIQTCLGYIIMIGSAAPAADAYGAWKDGSESLKRSTTILHCFRLCAWLVGGIWCLNA